MTKRTQWISGWRYVLLFPIALILYLWNRSLKVSVDEQSFSQISDTSRPVVCLFWHNRLFFSAELYRRFRKGLKMYGLVSASKDGAWLAALFHILGIRVVRGSSSFRAATALKALVKKTAEGNDIAITPDGPRGPRYSFSRGALLVAEKSPVDLLFVSPNYKSYWTLKSWDGFRIPKPFSKVELRGQRFKNLDELKKTMPGLKSYSEMAQKILLDLGVS